jgi:hypothetical protein
MVRQDLELARRAVACEGWRWMPGMLTSEGHRLDNAGRLKAEQKGDQLPDLDDPATVGCLLALVRKVWDDPAAHAVPNGGWDGGWHVCDEHAGARYVYGRGDTEAEALVVALEMF